MTIYNVCDNFFLMKDELSLGEACVCIVCHNSVVIFLIMLTTKILIIESINNFNKIIKLY